MKEENPTKYTKTPTIRINPLSDNKKKVIAKERRKKLLDKLSKLFQKYNLNNFYMDVNFRDENASIYIVDFYFPEDNCFLFIIDSDILNETNYAQNFISNFKKHFYAQGIHKLRFINDFMIEKLEHQEKDIQESFLIDKVSSNRRHYKGQDLTLKDLNEDEYETFVYENNLEIDYYSEDNIYKGLFSEKDNKLVEILFISPSLNNKYLLFNNHSANLTNTSGGLIRLFFSEDVENYIKEKKEQGFTDIYGINLSHLFASLYFKSFELMKDEFKLYKNIKTGDVSTLRNIMFDGFDLSLYVPILSPDVYCKHRIL